MAATKVLEANDITIPAAPPTFYVPDANGNRVPNGGATYELVVVSSLYPAGSEGMVAVEFEYDTGWAQDATATMGLGPHPAFGRIPANTASFGTSIGNNANPYPSHVRLRVDSVPAGTLDSVTITIT